MKKIYFAMYNYLLEIWEEEIGEKKKYIYILQSVPLKSEAPPIPVVDEHVFNE